MTRVLPAVAGVARLAWGTTLILAPGAVLVRWGASPDRRARTTLRVLGARHVLQSLVSGAQPGPSALRRAALVDGSHALSGVGLALVDRRWRRAALLDAAVAGAWTGVDLLLAATGPSADTARVALKPAR